jgi:hypothetical protein
MHHQIASLHTQIVTRFKSKTLGMSELARSLRNESRMIVFTLKLHEYEKQDSFFKQRRVNLQNRAARYCYSMFSSATPSEIVSYSLMQNLHITMNGIRKFVALSSWCDHVHEAENDGVCTMSGPQSCRLRVAREMYVVACRSMPRMR